MKIANSAVRVLCKPQKHFHRDSRNLTKIEISHNKCAKPVCQALNKATQKTRERIYHKLISAAVRRQLTEQQWDGLKNGKQLKTKRDTDPIGLTQTLERTSILWLNQNKSHIKKLIQAKQPLENWNDLKEHIKSTFMHCTSDHNQPNPTKPSGEINWIEPQEIVRMITRNIPEEVRFILNQMALE